VLFVRKLLRLPAIMQTLDKFARCPFSVNMDTISPDDAAKAGVLPDWHAIIDSVITQIFLSLDVRTEVAGMKSIGQATDWSPNDLVQMLECCLEGCQDHFDEPNCKSLFPSLASLKV
jgi:hypothetical protein